MASSTAMLFRDAVTVRETETERMLECVTWTKALAFRLFFVDRMCLSGLCDVIHSLSRRVQ